MQCFFAQFVNSNSATFLSTAFLIFLQMEKHTFFAVIFCTAFIHKGLGFPYNDVSIACDSMLPDSGSEPQRSTPPYVISVSFDRYDPGNKIKGKLYNPAEHGNIRSCHILNQAIG